MRAIRTTLLLATVTTGLALAAGGNAARPTTHPKEPKQQRARAVRTPAVAARGVHLLRLIRQHRDETWRWQRLMHRPLTPHADSATRSPSLRYRAWVVRLWAKRAVRERRLAASPPHLTAWLCIHRYEGSWTDPNAPYYGGLQMDWGFQATYGPELLRRKGTADRWTPTEQMWVAERAYASGRGFYPWPNTARYCGLI